MGTNSSRATTACSVKATVIYGHSRVTSSCFCAAAQQQQPAQQGVVRGQQTASAVAASLPLPSREIQLVNGALLAHAVQIRAGEVGRPCNMQAGMLEEPEL